MNAPLDSAPARERLVPLAAVLEARPGWAVTIASWPVRLLEAAEIPFDKPGRHRRIRLGDLLAYQQRVRRARAAGWHGRAGASGSAGGLGMSPQWSCGAALQQDVTASS
jgi:hypothetical protein